MDEKSILEFRLENLGDCEIDLIAFLGSSVRLNIVDPYLDRVLVIEFLQVGFFLFETNHVQNVIQEIKIYDDLSAAKSDKRMSKFIAERNLLGEITPGRKIAYIHPTTGAEGIVVFEEMSYHSTK